MTNRNKQVLVHSVMKYHCPYCGYDWWMFIEKGLEEPGMDHKPVPFAIQCKCGRFGHDISGLIPIPGFGKYKPLPESECYFANRKTSDCGVPITPWNGRK